MFCAMDGVAQELSGAGGFLFNTSHLLYELQKASSYLGVAYPPVCPDKL
jgi:hypothetical protein